MEEAVEASKGSLTCPRPPTIPGGGPRIPSGVLYADLVWSPHRTYSPPSNPIPHPRRGITLAESHWGEPAWLVCFPGLPSLGLDETSGRARGQAWPRPWWIALYPEAFCFACSIVGVGLWRRLIGVSSAALGGSQRNVGKFSMGDLPGPQQPLPNPFTRICGP